MLKVDIRRPRMRDRKELHSPSRKVVTDPFLKEGIGEKVSEMNEEIKVKEKYLESDFESNGEKRYSLIAIDDNKMIGSIEYGPASDFICK